MKLFCRARGKGNRKKKVKGEGAGKRMSCTPCVKVVFANLIVCTHLATLPTTLLEGFFCPVHDRRLVETKRLILSFVRVFFIRDGEEKRKNRRLADFTVRWVTLCRRCSCTALAGKKSAGEAKNGNASRFCVSSLRRGHANLLCIVPIVTDSNRPKSVLKEEITFFWYINRIRSNKLIIYQKKSVPLKSCGIRHYAFEYSI